jgi:hypothetical protein
MREAVDTQKWREDQIALAREKLAALAGREKTIPGGITEGQAVSIITGRKEDDPLNAVIAKSYNVPIPTGYKHSDKARRTMAKLLKERRGWSDEDINTLLDQEDSDPLGILGN